MTEQTPRDEVPEASSLEQPPEETGNEIVVAAGDVIDPAQVRRAPRFRSFILAGLGSGIVLGLVLGLILFRNADNTGAMTFVLVVDLTAVTTLIALIWAIVVERRSRKG